MTPLDFLTQPWAILPAALEGMAGVFASLPSEPQSVAARDGRRMDGARNAEVRDGVAVIPVRGAIARHESWFTSLLGMTSIETVAKDLTAAVNNPGVRAVMLDVDSPGGTALGTGELAAMVRAASEKKRVCCYSGGTLCSAAYYVGSAASEVVVSPSSLVGSIGVVSTVDTKKRPGQLTVVSSQSPLKHADPNTEAGLSELQGQLDAVADVFVSDVAKYRGTTPERVMSDFGRGGVKVGKAAVECGMADAVGDFEGTLARLSRGEALPERPRPRATAKVARAAAATHRGSTMNPFAVLASIWKADPEAVNTALKASSDADATNPFDRYIAMSTAPAEVKLEERAPVVDEAAVKARVKAEVEAEMKAAHATQMRSFFEGQAKSHFLGSVKAGKVTPADVPMLQALYVEYAAADASHGPLAYKDAAGKDVTVPRLDAFLKVLDGRKATDATAETMPANTTALDNGGGPTAEEKRAKAVNMVKSFRATYAGSEYLKTPEGKALLAEAGSI